MSGPIAYKGTLVAQEQSYEYDYDPSSGGKQTYEFDTFSEANAVALANANIANRVPTKYRLVHGAATVILSDSNFPGIDTWQILANENQKPRWDAPRILQLLDWGGDPTADYFGGVMTILKQGIDQRIKFNQLTQTLPDGSPGLSLIVGADREYLNNVYNLHMQGSDTYPSSGYVLRHETIVGNSYSSNIADSNVDCVYTVSQLLNEVQNASLWIFPLPGELQYFIQHLVAPAAQSGYLWGWLKRSATRGTAANNRVTLTTEYWLEQWEQTQLGFAI